MRLFGLVGLAMLAFAANSILNRLGVGGDLIAAQVFAVVRLATGVGVLFVLLVGRAALRGYGVGSGHFWPGWRGRVAGVGGLLLYLFGFSAAYLALDAGTGALILFGVVQITMFAGALAAGEALPGRRVIGAALALGGLGLLLAPQGGAVGPQVMMAAAGLGWGVYSLAGRGQTDPLGGTAWNFLLALPFGLVVLAIWPGQASLTGLALAMLSGGVTSGLGYALWYAIIPRLGAARAGVAQLTVPVIAAAGGFVLIGEVPGPEVWGGAVLVLGGVGFALLPRR